MKRFALVFEKDIQSGLAYIWFNQDADKAEVHKTYSTSVPQAKHQQATEKRLLKELKKTLPAATIFEDDKGYRYIKTH